MSLSKIEYQTQLAIDLEQLACDPKFQPYIAQGLINNRRIVATGSLALARLLLNATPTTCPGAVDINAEARAKLQKIIARFESDENLEPVSSIDPAAFDRHREIQ